MFATKCFLCLSVMMQLSLSSMFLAAVAARTAAAAGSLASSTAVVTDNAGFEAISSARHQQSQAAAHHRRLKEYLIDAVPIKRRLEESLGSEDESSDDNDDYDGLPTIITNGTGVVGSAQKQSEVCTPVDECELCPHNYKVLIEKEDEKIKGEYDSCEKYGRRRQFECTVLFQETEDSEKIAGSTSEYRSCRYTEADEQYRMLRMQMICLLVGVLAMRNVRRQKVASASLFDQRRMRIQNSANGGSASSSARKHSTFQRKDSMETVELIPMAGSGKIPKSPAPTLNPSNMV